MTKAEKTVEIEKIRNYKNVQNVLIFLTIFLFGVALTSSIFMCFNFEYWLAIVFCICLGLMAINIGLIFLAQDKIIDLEELEK